MKNFFASFVSFCKSAFPLVVFFMGIVNLVIAFKISSSVKPSYQYRTFIVTNVIDNVSLPLAPTNDISHSSLSLSTNSAPVLSRQVTDPGSIVPPDRSIPVAYRYSLVGSEPVAYMFNRYYYEGEATSRGLILRIFPDRIYLHDGSYFVNTSVVSETPKKSFKREFFND